MVMALDYCLIYRMVVIMESPRFHRFLLSMPGFVAFISFGVLMAGAVAALAYGFIEVTQVGAWDSNKRRAQLLTTVEVSRGSGCTRGRFRF